jgi:hypothetical protein
MDLSVRGDPGRPGGGYAILEADAGALPDRIAVEDGTAGVFLNDEGQWTGDPFLFSVERLGSSSVLLGRRIVDGNPSETPVAFHGPDGEVFGSLLWPSSFRPRENKREVEGLAGGEAFDALLKQLTAPFALAPALNSPPSLPPLRFPRRESLPCVVHLVRSLLQ